jgi:aminoglycoside phosphotransferase (APT) family kinase protein
VKLRVFSSARQAVVVWRLLTAAPTAVLPRPLLIAGRAIVVEYVEGVPLDRVWRRVSVTERERLVRAVGRLVGRLHRASRAGRKVSPLANEAFLRLVTRRLRRRRLIDAATAASLRAIRRPVAARLVLTHGDVCPQNVVITAGGRVRLVDEERLDWRPAGFELARAVTRWPMTPALEATFVSAYRGAGCAAPSWPEDRAFWVAVALAISANHRLARRLPGVQRAVGWLRRTAGRP